MDSMRKKVRVIHGQDFYSGDFQPQQFLFKVLGVVMAVLVLGWFVWAIIR